MNQKRFAKLILIALAFSAFGCQKNVFQTPAVAPATLRDVAAVKLNFRFENDVPAPPANAQTAQNEERNAAIQSDFDRNRAQELLDKTIASPDKQRILAVYHRADDLPAEFRLDMYSPDGKLLKKITPNQMAVHFAETILWSPDSSDAAFVAMARTGENAQSSAPPAAASASPNPTENAANDSTNTDSNQTNANAANANATSENTNAEIADANAAPGQTPAAAAVEEAPGGILTFRTEQLYICTRDGGDVKPLTQNEGLIYFYFVWSPDGASLAALAETFQEWRFMQAQADGKNEIFIPAGRLRIVEKTGRERRLDDNLTTVRPAWSPDAAKVATAFGTQVRIYDATGDAPTQAAVPLRNQLLMSSKTYDENEQRKQEQTTPMPDANTNANANAKSNMKSNAKSNAVNAAASSNANQTANANAATNQPVGSLPDESTLSSFNPIISLEWTEDKMLYLQTGYVKQIKNEIGAHSFLRWHRLVFSPQAAALGGGK